MPETLVKVNVSPRGDRVLIRPSEAEEKSKGGIVIPDAAKEKPQEGTVIAVGPGKLLDNGERSKMDLKEGDVVLYGKWGGNDIKIDGEEYKVISEGDIIAVMNNG